MHANANRCTHAYEHIDARSYTKKHTHTHTHTHARTRVREDTHIILPVICVYQFFLLLLKTICSVGWSCRIHWLNFCRGVRPSNECPSYDIKQSDGEVPAVLEFWEMRSTPSLLSLLGPLWHGVVAPDRALSMG